MSYELPKEDTKILKLTFLIAAIGPLFGYISYLIFYESFVIGFFICNMIFGSFVWELKIPDLDRPNLSKPLPVSNILALGKAVVYLNLYGIGFLYIFICSVIIVMKKIFRF